MSDDPLIGAQLGEYRVLAPLGKGGMGIVYRGEQPLIGKRVAIKVLRPELLQEPREVRRLLEEARAVNAVRHPGLVDIFSFGATPGGAQYFVMELLEGQSLQALLATRGRLKVWEALPILDGVLAALAAAHGAGVIHRDLKPSNIFLVDLPDHTTQVKLLDFGLAKRVSPGGGAPQTKAMAVGTPEYMAPEQARALDVSPRTDLYAVGCVAYELLTGDVPFAGATPVETMVMHFERPPRPPGELEPSIPPPLEAIVLQLLEKQAADRPASAADVRQELQRIHKQLSYAHTQVAPQRGAVATLLVRASELPTAAPPVPNAGPEPVPTQPLNADPPSFQVEQRLGSGGMAEVHLARMTRGKKTEAVALKRIHGQLAKDPEAVKLFQREALIGESLVHENIVGVRAWGHDALGPFLALEYVDGRSAHVLLKAAVGAGQLLPLEVAFTICLDAATGLEHAHRWVDARSGVRGILHRDISPDNVLITANGVAKLADFGIAKALAGTRLTRTGTVKGKYGYMAPELFRGKEADFTTDYFALAATAFKLISGTAPFDGRNEAELVNAVLHAEAPRLSSLRPGVPAEVDGWIAKALAKQQADRPAEIGGFIAALERAVGPSRAQARRAVQQTLTAVAEALGPAATPSSATLPDTVPSGSRRPLRRLAPVLVFALMAVVGAGIGSVWSLSGRSDAPAVAVAPPRREPEHEAPPVEPPPVVAPAKVLPPVEAPRPVPPPPRPATPRQRPATVALTPAPAAVAAAARGPGTLVVKSNPWAKVFVDGRPRGPTPTPPISLEPGKHTVLLVNNDLNLERSITVAIEPGKEQELKVQLSQP